MSAKDLDLILLNRNQLPTDYKPRTIVYRVNGVEVYRLEDLGTLQEKEVDFDTERYQEFKLFEAFWDGQLVFLVKQGVILVNRLRLSHNNMRL